MPPSIEKFLELETQVWEALKSGDRDLDAKMLSDDFLGVYPSGFAGKQQHSAQLDHGPAVANYRIEDARLIAIANDQVLLSYLAVWSRWKNGNPGAEERMYISSIWKCTDDVWKNTFSQDTPAG